MRKIHLRKSTKILVCILVFVISVGATLAILYREQLFAQNIPEPEEKPCTEPPNVNESTNDPCITFPPSKDCSGTTIDSGGSFWVECKTVDQVNTAPLNGDEFTLSFKYKIIFQKTCKEYINTAKILFNGGSEEKPIIEDLGFAEKDQTYIKEGTMTKTFKLDEGYWYMIKMLIRRQSPWPPFYVDQGDYWSNACMFSRSTNPDETIGEEITEEDVTTGSGEDRNACGRECKEKSGCEEKGIVKGGIMSGPICNSMCAVQCTVLDMMASIFNWAFKLLHGAVGIS